MRLRKVEIGLRSRHPRLRDRRRYVGGAPGKIYDAVDGCLSVDAPLTDTTGNPRVLDVAV